MGLQKDIHINDDTLKEFAFCYTVGASGKGSTPRWMMSVEDAKTWCSSELSKGVLLGCKWAYFWTTVHNFCFFHLGSLKGAVLDLSKMEDNGKFDEKVNSLRLKKYGKNEIKDILAKAGIEVKL